jgi:HK97 family phage major capsid protein
LDPNELLTAPEPKTRAEAAGLHARIHGAAKAIFAKGDDATADELAHFDKLRAKGDAVKAFLDSRPDASAMKAWVDDQEKFIRTPVAPAPQASGKGFEVRGIERDGHTDISRKGRDVVSEVGRSILGEKAWDAMQEPTYAKAFYGEYLRKGERMSAGAYKALEVGVDDQGGYFAPPTTIQRVVGREPTPTRIGGMVDVVTSASDSVQMFKTNYVSNSSDDPNGYIYPTSFRVSFGNERSDLSGTTYDQTNNSSLFGMIRIPVYTALIEGRITWQQAEDAGFDTQGWVESKMNQTADLLYDNMILNGTGVGQPLGIIPSVNALPAGDVVPQISSGSAGTIVTDDILNISEDVPEQYDDDSVFVFAKTTTNKLIRKIKTTAGDPIFRQGLADAGYAGPGMNRRMLNGYPVVWSQFMPSVATGNVPVLFGDLKGYTRVTRVGFSIQVLREIEALKQRVVLVGRLRFGGAPVEPWRLRGLKIT